MKNPKPSLFKGEQNNRVIYKKGGYYNQFLQQ